MKNIKITKIHSQNKVILTDFPYSQNKAKQPNRKFQGQTKSNKAKFEEFGCGTAKLVALSGAKTQQVEVTGS